MGGPLPPPGACEVRYEGVQHDPYGSPYAAVPPPPCLDASFSGKSRGKGRSKSGRGYKGGKGSDFDGVETMRAVMSDGLIASNVPSELNTLDALNRHFRRFGEVLKISCDATEGRAFVQFADPASAETAANVPVLDSPDITLEWAPRPRGKGKGGHGSHNGKGGKGSDRFVENRVFVADPEEQRRQEESKRKRDEVSTKTAQLLGKFTEQMKTIMMKLSDPELTEAKRETLQNLLQTIKRQMDAVNCVGYQEDGMQRPALLATPSKGKSKGDRLSSSSSTTSGGKWTLDLRTRVLMVNLVQGWTLDRLKEELKKFGAAEEQVESVQVGPSTGAMSGGTTTSGVNGGSEAGESGGGAEAAFVRFRDRRSAEQLFNRRGELPFYAEWCEQPPASPAMSPAPTPAAPPRIGSAGNSSMGETEPLPPSAADAAAAEGIGGGIISAADEAADGDTAAPEVAYGVDLSEEEDAGGGGGGGQ